MTISRSGGRARRAAYAAALLAAALILPPFAIANTGPATLSAADEQCLTCHSITGLSKSLGDGGKLPLHVARDEFSESVHSLIGCRGCHRSIDVNQHPAMRSIASAREFTLEATQVCKNCHAGKFDQYESSIHASLVASGDESAPVCSSCHDAHAVQPVATYEPATGKPCKTCHEAIFDAYAGSVHGQARVAGGQSQAPYCSDCHMAHEVTAVAAGDRLKQACLSCHEGVTSLHNEWLPNSGRHLESVSCPACHSPMADRSVDLRLYDSETRELVATDPGFEERVSSIDTAGDGLDPLELWTLVRQTNSDSEETRLTLRGRLEVSDGAQAHQLAFKTEAVRDCNTCHQHGAEAYENVTVSVTDSDGRRLRYAAEDDTLTSAVSVDSVGGFYTAGGTRIKLLDVLLVLGVLAGLGIPVAHWTMRKLAKKKG